MQTCEECGQDFVFTVEEQRQLQKRGQEIKAPALCPNCRKAEKSDRPSEQRESSKAPESSDLPEGVKLIGHVKWYSPQKGYGFITNAKGDEIFVHRSSLSAGVYRLDEGERVEFEEQQTEKGPEAINVAPLGK